MATRRSKARGKNPTSATGRHKARTSRIKRAETEGWSHGFNQKLGFSQPSNKVKPPPYVAAARKSSGAVRSASYRGESAGLWDRSVMNAKNNRDAAKRGSAASRQRKRRK